MSYDLRLLTGPSSMVIGAICLLFGLRLWLTHPTRLVIRLAPTFEKAEVVNAVIGMRLLLTVLGGFLFVNGTASVRFWYVVDHRLYDPVVAFLGGASGVLALSAAIVTVRDALRWLRRP